ncbi:MAG: hypothetical protein IJ092_00865 [Atopobiaceae bacterium]|nr:hypothetical protein [Atopobiaceae bacterium]
MTVLEEPIDCAAELAAWLAESGHDAVADVLPDGFMDRLPIVLLRSSGGVREWPVIDRHRIGVDAYGETVNEALAEARAVYALLDTINAIPPMLGGAQAYSFASGGLPQRADDPEHPDAPMATFLAEVATRAKHTD